MPSGISGASRSKVSRSTSSVLRSRALTPISRAPASTARSTSSAVWHSTSGVRPDRLGPLDQCDEGVLLERGDEQQRQVGAAGARLPQLVAGEDEVLAQHRNLDGGADRLEVVESAAETAPLGEHADRRSAASLVVRGQRRPGR